MRKVGVTGGRGFIGGWVCAELRSRGYEVVVLDHHAQAGPPAGCEMFLGDVRDATTMTELAAHVDGIVHLAAVLGTQETIQNPRPAAESNIMGGLNFLEAVAQYDLPGVYIAVGNHFMHTNTYSVTKTCVEHFVEMFNKARSTRVNTVRCVNAYGPRQLAAVPFGAAKVRKITPSFVCRALSGMSIEVYGDGEQISDMLYVGDLARVLVDALELAAKGTVLDYVLEAGPTEHATVNEVAQLVVDEASLRTGKHVEIVHLPMRPGEIPGATVCADRSTLHQAGVAADFVDLAVGMALTVDWFADNKGVTWSPPASS